MLAVCRFPVFSIDDYSEILNARETAVHSVLNIGESGEVIAEGEALSVSGLGSDCWDEKDQCYFSMDVEGVVVFIHYSFDRDHRDCLNTKASEQATRLRAGDRVRVFGDHYGSGNISICGSRGYYVKILPSENSAQ